MQLRAAIQGVNLLGLNATFVETFVAAFVSFSSDLKGAVTGPLAIRIFSYETDTTESALLQPSLPI